MFIISKHSALSSTRQDVFLILTASAAVPPRTQSAAQLPSTAPHDRKTRLRAVTSSRDSWRSHVHRARLRSACSSSSTRPAMSGVEGDAPCLSLGDSKGVFSSKREYPLWCRGAHAAPPSHPCEKAGHSLSRGSPPLPRAAPSALPSPPALSCRKSKSDGFFSRRFSICITAKPFCCRGWPSCAALC